jgi:hypothetical protein
MVTAFVKIVVPTHGSCVGTTIGPSPSKDLGLFYGSSHFL